MSAGTRPAAVGRRQRELERRVHEAACLRHPALQLLPQLVCAPLRSVCTWHAGRVGTACGSGLGRPNCGGAGGAMAVQRRRAHWTAGISPGVATSAAGARAGWEDAAAAEEPLLRGTGSLAHTTGESVACTVAAIFVEQAQVKLQCARNGHAHPTPLRRAAPAAIARPALHS